MPSPQTVIAITLVGSIVGAIAGALFIYDWIRKRAKALREGGTSPVMRWPKVTLALLLFTILCSTIGLWLLFHLPKPSLAASCPAVKECPICPPAPKSETASTKPTAPKGTVTGTTVSQPGNGDRRVGSVTQTVKGNSGCTQVVGVGDNNTNICKAQPVTITDAQANKAISYLQKSPNLAGKVVIWYEYSARPEGAEHLASQLQKILKAENIDAEINSAATVGTCGRDTYPGLSFACLRDSNKDLADLIEKSLKTAKVINEPMKQEKDEIGLNQPLFIMIRKVE